MKKLFLVLLVCGLNTTLVAQIIELDTVVVSPIKYKYLFEVLDDDIDKSVKDLQKKLAEFDVTTEYLFTYQKGMLLRPMTKMAN